LAQRSRKRGRRAKGPAPRGKPGAQPGRKPAPVGEIGGWKVEAPMTRSQRRDAAIRAGLTPLTAGERPTAIVISTVLAGLIGLSQLILFAVGIKIQGKSPALAGTVLFCALMIACAVGMWRLWYGAVLAFMALLAIVACLFSLFLIEASNLLALVVAPVIVVGAGWLFFKLVRVLSRIQMPKPPGR
jgi:hypothetical protein